VKAPPATPEPHAGLIAKYRSLCEKHARLMSRVEDLSAQHVDLMSLGRWAVTTHGFGVALVDGELVRVSNQRWRDLDRGRRTSARWRPLDDGVGAAATAGGLNLSPSTGGVLTLGELAQRLAAEVLARRLPVARRFTRPRPQQTLELRAEAVTGRPGHVVVAALDVSSMVAVAAELTLVRERLGLRERLRRVGELTAGVAHDVNNALNALRLRLELVKPREPRDEENMAAMRRVLADATLRLASLQDTGRRPTATRSAITTSLRRVVHDAVALFRPATARGKGGVRVRVAVPALRLTGASAAELRHVFLNLLLNARDAMPTGGVITIDARQTTEGVVVRVSDEGTGIPVEILPRIFEPFFTTKAERGSGLGLFTARNVMARLGGSISASNRESGGAVVTLTFPRAARAGASAAAVLAARRARPTRAAGSQVLVVDDDDESRKALVAVLSGWGLAVTAAATGGEALMRVDRGLVPDLVLCELALPDAGAFELAAGIRQRGLEPLFHMLTGDGFELSHHPQRDLVDGVLTKPIAARDLAALVPPVSPALERSGTRRSRLSRGGA
jgi:signal transduction histidine kinase/CheY-like chemotaxis protein